MNGIHPRVRADANLAFARAEQRRFQRDTSAFLSFAQDATSLHQGLTTRETSAGERVKFHNFMRQLDQYLAFRTTEFRGASSRRVPKSVIATKERTWRAAAGYALSRPADVEGQQLDLIWNIATHIGGVADWPTYTIATSEQEKSYMPASAARVVRKHHDKWKALNRRIAGELVMLAGYQAIRHNRRQVQRYLHDFFIPTANATRSASQDAHQLVENPRALAYTRSEIDKRWKAVQSINDLANAWVAQLTKERDETAVGNSREYTLVLHPSDSGDHRETVVVVVGHDDDFHSKFASTCQKLKEDGYKVVVAVGTDGSGGDPQNPKHDTVEHHHDFFDIRLNETVAAMSHAGVDEVVFMGYGDSGMSDDPSLHEYRLTDIYRRTPNAVIDQMASIFQRYDANLVLTHQALGEQLGNYAHPDHLAMVKVCMAAAQKRFVKDKGPFVYGVSLSKEELQDAHHGIVGDTPLAATSIAPGAVPTTEVTIEPRHVRVAREGLEKYVSQVVLEARAYLVGAPGKSYWTQLVPPPIPGLTLEQGFRQSTARGRADLTDDKPLVAFVQTSDPTKVGPLSAIRNRLVNAEYPTAASNATTTAELRSDLTAMRQTHERPIIVVDSGSLALQLGSNFGNDNSSNTYDALIAINPARSSANPQLAANVKVPFLVLSGSGNISPADNESYVQTAVDDISDLLIIESADELLRAQPDGYRETAEGSIAWVHSIQPALSTT